LSKDRKKILLYLLRFLKQEVLKHKKNRMTENSMSIVFSPCFFRPRVETFYDLLNSGKFAWVLYVVIKHYEEVLEMEENWMGAAELAKDKRGSKGSRGSGQGELKQKNTNIL
jgi:hypothetical protein